MELKFDAAQYAIKTNTEIKKVPVNMRLTSKEIECLRKLGNGNVTEGVRALVDAACKGGYCE